MSAERWAERVSRLETASLKRPLCALFKDIAGAAETKGRRGDRG